jgi:Peptidase family S51
MTAGKCRILAIMGSGETSPTMVTVHKALVAQLGPGTPDAALLDTPYAFQENAADVSARARSYFAASVGLTVTTLADGGDAMRVRTADWVFAGPGSPSYALARWRGHPVGDALRDRVASGTGVTVLASAAAATIGVTAVPVYEIYKAGIDPHWLEGLNLLAAVGLPVAVIPHYDNAEGGTHDTRFCYLGERRLAAMEPELPAGAAVLGIDEHTAVILDLSAETAEIRGRGGLTIRRAGVSTVLTAPAVVSLAQLRSMIRTGESAIAVPSLVTSEPAEELLPLADLTRRAETSFEEALGERDAAGMITAILELEASIHSWTADTEEDQGSSQARAAFRGLITRLGEALAEGLRDPAERFGPVVDPLLALRSALRSGGRYQDADVIRDALIAAGLTISDDSTGTRWAASRR